MQWLVRFLEQKFHILCNTRIQATYFFLSHKSVALSKYEARHKGKFRYLIHSTQMTDTHFLGSYPRSEKLGHIIFVSWDFLYLRLRKMSHTMYAANGKVSHIHRRMCEWDYTIDKSLLRFYYRYILFQFLYFILA
jgi:hypothetical protein